MGAGAEAGSGRELGQRVRLRRKVLVAWGSNMGDVHTYAHLSFLLC